MQHNGLFVALTGLSGSGKTTIAKGAQEILESKGYKVDLVDENKYCQTVCSDLNLSSEEGQEENINRLSFIAQRKAKGRRIVILAAVNPYASTQNVCKDRGAVLVHVFCPFDVCRERDPEGLYKKHGDHQMPGGQATGAFRFDDPGFNCLAIFTDSTNPQRAQKDCAKDLARIILCHFI